jgi:hypothetical protein
MLYRLKAHRNSYVSRCAGAQSRQGVKGYGEKVEKLQKIKIIDITGAQPYNKQEPSLKRMASRIGGREDHVGSPCQSRRVSGQRSEKI